MDHIKKIKAFLDRHAVTDLQERIDSAKSWAELFQEMVANLDWTNVTEIAGCRWMIMARGLSQLGERPKPGSWTHTKTKNNMKTESSSCDVKVEATFRDMAFSVICIWWLKDIRWSTRAQATPWFRKHKLRTNDLKTETIQRTKAYESPERPHDVMRVVSK